MTGEFSDDALAEQFADRFCDDFLYISDAGWFRRKVDQVGNPAWVPDRELSIIRAIRIFLRGLAEERPRGCGIRTRLGSLATIRAVEELARSDFAGIETDLEPGELAQQEERTRAFREAVRATGRQQTPLAVPAPRQPVPDRPAAPAVKITLSRRAKAVKRQVEAAREYGTRATAYSGLQPAAQAEADG